MMRMYQDSSLILRRNYFSVILIPLLLFVFIACLQNPVSRAVAGALSDCPNSNEKNQQRHDLVSLHLESANRQNQTLIKTNICNFVNKLKCYLTTTTKEEQVQSTSTVPVVERELLTAEEINRNVFKRRQGGRDPVPRAKAPIIFVPRTKRPTKAPTKRPRAPKPPPPAPTKAPDPIKVPRTPTPVKAPAPARPPAPVKNPVKKTPTKAAIPKAPIKKVTTKAPLPKSSAPKIPSSPVGTPVPLKSPLGNSGVTPFPIILSPNAPAPKTTTRPGSSSTVAPNKNTKAPASLSPNIITPTPPAPKTTTGPGSSSTTAPNKNTKEPVSLSPNYTTPTPPAPAPDSPTVKTPTLITSPSPPNNISNNSRPVPVPTVQNNPTASQSPNNPTAPTLSAAVPPTLGLPTQPSIPTPSSPTDPTTASAPARRNYVMKA